MERTNKKRILDICYIALFAAVIAACAWISIPYTVPFTLQTFGVFMAVAVLGGKRGTIAVLLYLALGCIGAPVFAGFGGGLGYVLGSTGGYIVGFLFSALVMWLMEKLFGRSTWNLFLSMIAGLLVCYLFGTIWFVVVYTRTKGAMGFGAALTACVIPYIPFDLMKIGLAMLVSGKLRKILKLDVKK